MTKAQVMELVKRYNMQELVNNEIERVQIGWSMLSDEYIDQLDNIANGYADTDPVTVTAHYTGYEHQTLYTIIVPASWICSTPGCKSSQTYMIRYNTGAGDEEITGTLATAKRIADDGAAYTQQDIVIEDESGDEVARRVWYGVELTEEDMTEDEDQYITFGSFGYYAPWQEVGGND